MKKLVLMIMLCFAGGSVYAQGTQVLSYGYPMGAYNYYAPVVPSVVQYQPVFVNGVIVDTTPRVTVIAPVLPVAPIVHPVPVVIQPVVPLAQPVHRCWWPRPWVYNYGY